MFCEVDAFAHFHDGVEPRMEVACAQRNAPFLESLACLCNMYLACIHRLVQILTCLPTPRSMLLSDPGCVRQVGSLNCDLVLPVKRVPLPGETLAADGLDTVPGGKVCGVQNHCLVNYLDAHTLGARVA